MFTGLETAEERLAICQRDSMAKREVIQRLKAEVERLRWALKEIRDMDFLDSALDNRWPSRIARAALAGEEDGHG